MPDSQRRTAAEREAARRERENRRARLAGRPAPELAPEPEPPAPAPPAPAPAPPAPDPEPPAPEPEPPAPDPDPPLARPIKSFPSPPDPDFYAPDDELETPSGTRRVRGARPAQRRGSRPPRAPRRDRAGGVRRSHRWLGRFLALVALLLAAAVVWFLIELFQPFGTSPHGQVIVHIPARTPSGTVARMLQADGVVSSHLFFEVRAALDGDRGKIRAGTYHLKRGMSYGSVLTVITRVPKAAKTSQLTIVGGHTRQYVAALLRRQHVKGSYLTASRHSKLLSPRHYGAPKSTRTLEGFLFPDTFTLRDPISAPAVVADQLRDFKRRFAAVNLGWAHHHHLSAFDVVTIASLIQGEAASARDDRLVSSVIDNRLRDHMMLQLDSTTRYATGNFTKALTGRQLSSRSPYNTRTHFGLPPGPINSPGLTALHAAAHPASTRYLYFFTKPCTSRNVFATSYSQFEVLLLRDHRSHCPKH